MIFEVHLVFLVYVPAGLLILKEINKKGSNRNNDIALLMPAAFIARRSFKFIFTFFELPIQIDIARRKQAPLATE